MSSVSTTSAPAAVPRRHPSFASLRHAGFRPYLVGNALAMMADSIEHVISYWVMYQKFHSPALGGFAVISHWVPFLLFGVWSGALADRFDPRRIIQIGMALFMLCSLTWAVLFHLGWLEEWHAVAILTVHGNASLFWGPASQVLIHDIVGPEELPSAVRLMATSRYLGLLAGPAVGGVILLALGPSHGLLLNSLIYLPLTLWLARAPYGPRFRKEKIVSQRIRGLDDLVSTVQIVASVRVLAAMTVLTGAYALLVGNAYQAQMPGFARDLGHGDPGVLYSLLLGSDALGAFLAGIVLEGSGWLLPKARTAFALAMLWCCAISAFALAPTYPMALVALFCAGFLELSFNSMAQTLVQLNAPTDMRGRVIGFFGMSAIGLRAFSGVTVGIGGSLLGIHRSVATCAVILLVVIAGLAWSMRAKPVPAE
ncbi:MAG TPA: MFS transporter [Stellaceae bacterium]|nr:MFS transporter [Stellaceae bacterium]